MSFSRTLFCLLVVAGTVPASAQAAPTGRAARTFGDADVIDRIRNADANRDGVVTRSELLAHRATEWPRMDRDGDGYFSRYDLPGFARDRWDGGRLAAMRQTYDDDRDGRISRAEFLSGPTLAFDMIDANADGRVTEAEIKAALARAQQR